MTGTSFNVISRSDPAYKEASQINPLLICTSCFGLTSGGKTTQKCRCEPRIESEMSDVDCPSGFHLCCICSRTVTGGYSRFAWEACTFCLAVNQSIRGRFRASLPLGRHSFMNIGPIQITTSTEPSSEPSSNLIEDMLHSVQIQRSFWDWGSLRARELFESVPSWANHKVIALADWEETFPSTRKNSLYAFRAYFGVKTLSELLNRAKANNEGER